ncbi:phosphoethanolamine transferase [uncultured Winogradskyella sp.]|uniref:phosphoethanolamine transferase n=1 Tax=uncultured Winogradskyella sp. TaxID=395353 RepID=UPI00261784FF|nr:phosphoethanolamine transferase [uncultured Winogradskyella sp.]
MREYFNIYLKPSVAILLYPVLLSLMLEIIIHEIEFSTFLNLAENILFAVVVLIMVNLLSYFKYGKTLANFIIGAFYLMLIIETGLYLLFQTRFNASYIYVILNTNYNEVREFSIVYYNKNLFWLLLFFVPLFPFFKGKIFKKVNSISKKLRPNFIAIIIILAILKFSGLIVYNLSYITIKSYVQYNEQIESINASINSKNNLKTELVTDNDVVVVVIGESASRKHMEIYGYSRNTNPNLKALSDSLVVYNNVISSHAYTTGSIKDIFTLSNYETPNAANTLINYVKSAGFRVVWLSNHRAVGVHDNLVSRLASSSDETLFLNYNDFRKNTLHDEVLLPKIKNKLSEKGKKVIFVHLVGSHYAYNKRYPDSFIKFSSAEENKKDEIIDTYDNSILYTDFILSEIIDSVKNINQKSAVLYFSDHGEEVYDVANYFGHFEDKPTSSMYEVPFFVYMSPTFERPEGFVVDESRPYMLDDFPHSFAHLIGIESDSLSKSRSIFSDNFKARKRIIQENIDFDEFKSIENK